MIAFPKSSDAVHLQQLSNNLRYVIAQRGMTLAEVVSASGVDERTVRGILKQRSKPHSQTIHKLAAGLGVDERELLLRDNPAASFDRKSNPAAVRVIDENPRLFVRWTSADYEEYFSRFGVGGELTEDAALRIAQEMNRRREVLRDVMLILESNQATIFREMVGVFFRDITSTVAKAKSA